MISKFEGLLKNRNFLTATIAFSAFILTLLTYQIGLFESLEMQTYDWRFLLRGQQDMSRSGIVIVGVDNQSFTALKKRWPFPRSLYARAIRNLKSAGARYIIFDMEFSEPSENPREDAEFVKAAREVGNVYVGGKIARLKNNAGRTLIKPFESLEKAASWALVDSPEDYDGFTRRYFAFRLFQKNVYFPFAPHLYQKIFRRNQLNIQGENLYFGEHHVPNFANTFLINFRGPAGTFPTYSFASIIDDKNYRLSGGLDDDIFDYHREWGTFKNKVVFIGATAEILQDVKLTPFFGGDNASQKMPGVEVHANAFSTLLNRDFISQVSGFNNVVLILIFSVIMAWFGVRKSTWIGLAIAGGLSVALLAVTSWLFVESYLWVEVVRPVTAIAFAYVGSVMQQVMFERREKSRVRKTFQQYVAKSVVDHMLESGKQPEFGGERRNLTVLFSDVRGFTTFTEKYDERAVVNTLNEYLTAMVDIVFRHGGTLDKFMGDAIMAIYGAPLHFDNHPLRACETAYEMIESLRHLQKRWSQNNQDFFQIGLGVNTGDMIVGNLGSDQHFDYTVIGDEVNLASRLEGANKQYWTSIIISGSTYEQVKKDVVARELDLVRVKGKHQPVKIYELRGIGGVPRIEKELVVDVYEYGLSLYKEQQWYEAMREFKRVLKYFPSDGPSRVYIKRCLDFIEAPPQEAWDGVYEFTSK